MNYSNDKDFTRNNNTVTVKLNKFSKDFSIKLLKEGENYKDREKTAQELINYLCDKFKICRSKVTVLNLNQPHSTSDRNTLKSVKMGDYNPNSHVIRVWNLTAKQGKTVSIKSFLDTLLHEFIHHYDFTVLKFNQSPHTSGFYKRLSDLSVKVKP